MHAFTARPERIIGNGALASLLGGFPAALAVSILAFALSDSREYSLATLGALIGSGAFGVAFIAICGLVAIAPALAVLRHFGLGGPFFVYAIGLAISLPFFSNGVLPGLAVIAMAGATAFVFCRFAYPDGASTGQDPFAESR